MLYISQHLVPKYGVFSRLPTHFPYKGRLHVNYLFTNDRLFQTKIINQNFELTILQIQILIAHRLTFSHAFFPHTFLKKSKNVFLLTQNVQKRRHEIPRKNPYTVHIRAHIVRAKNAI